MPRGSPLTQAEIAEVVKAIQQTGGNKKQAAALLGLARSQLYKRLQMAPKVKEEVRRSPLKTRRPIARGTWRPRITPDPATAIAELEEKAEFSVEHTPELGTSKHTWEIKSDKQNRYKFAAFGDLHAASKYCRWDVRGDLTKQAEDFGATAIFDAGNWCDGEMSFNRYDLEAVGMDPQLQVLARNYPKTKIPTYAITGADHEGWWIRREGVDVGRYCESIMRDAGHAWTNLGYLEADVVLVNANSGQRATLRIMHAGGGSAYAISYKPQKILECVPLDSEILTKSGWATHDEIEIGDEVLGYNVEKDCCEWTEVTAIHKGIGDVTRYSNDQFDVRCTPNHRWAIEWESRGPRYKGKAYPPRLSRHLWTIDENKDRSRIIHAALAPDGPGMPKMEHTDWLRRDVAVQTVMKMTSGERRAFIEGMLVGEGSIANTRGYRSIHFSQRPGPVCDAFRLACFLEGIATTDRGYSPGSFKPDGLPTRVVTMLKKRKRICNRLRIKDEREQMVWCVSTPLKTWVMRQGNLITITGNSLEGGEKPSVVLIGHYHKLDSGLVRNTWYAQVGCQQDQTPFMRQRSLEAHVGGILLEMEQDPRDGSISGFLPNMRRYFAKAYYFRSGQANQRWSGHGPIREVPRGANIKG